MSMVAAPKREFRGAWIQCVNGQFLGMSTDKMQQTLRYQLDELQKDGVKAVMEIPTYPYDSEYKAQGMSKQIFQDKLFRNRLARELDAIVTFSDYPRIFGQRTIRISNGIDFEHVSMKTTVNDTSQTLNLIGVAEIHRWHGFDRLVKGLADSRVKGRIELVDISDRFSIIIDYAHNAIALKSILETLRDYNPGRIVTIFGCGGNRSRERRFEMGEVSGQLSDFTIITSDNPRFEDPLDIIKDIKVGIEKTSKNYIEIPDRADAVLYAIENAKEGDIIVLAGKGHENYQEIKGVKHHMEEAELIMDAVDKLKAKGINV